MRLNSTKKMRSWLEFSLQWGFSNSIPQTLGTKHLFTDEAVLCNVGLTAASQTYPLVTPVLSPLSTPMTIRKTSLEGVGI